jgi:transposase
MAIGAHLLTFGYTFTAWQSLSHEEVRPHIEDLCVGKTPLLTEARGHCSGVPLPQSSRAIIQQAYQTYDLWRGRTNQLERELIRRVKELTWPTLSGARPGGDVMKVLDSIPGVGELTAAVWLVQIGDAGRFLFAKQIAAYCGFDPSLKVSADRVTANVRRKGNKLLHKMLAQAAQSVIRRSAEPLGWWGLRLARKGKGAYQKAVGAVGRRIAMALWLCQSRMEPWSHEGYASLRGATPCRNEQETETRKPNRPRRPPQGCSSGESSRPDADASSGSAR